MGLVTEDELSSGAHIASLISSFAVVPAAAVPAIIDCVLVSASSLSAAQLFSSLLNSLANLVQDDLSEKGSKLDSAQLNLVVSHVNALFHLIKDSRTGSDAFGLLIWKGLVPLLQVTDHSDKEFLNEMEHVLCDAVLSCHSWELMEETLVPVCLRSVGHFSGMPESIGNAIFPWSKELPLHWRSYELNSSCFLPPLVACRFLTSLLDVSLKAEFVRVSERQNSRELKLVDESWSSCSFTCNLIWDLSYIIINMLSKGSEQRSSSIYLLLPSLFKAFTVLSSCQIHIHGMLFTTFRNCFFEKVWKCCLSLFSLGQVERRDAYSILAQYYNFFSNDKVGRDVSDAEFDIILEKEFWQEIHRGLVDSDATSRKLSLYILKICLGNQAAGQFPWDASYCPNRPMNGFDGQLGSTKRGKWADEEAKSLGVGEFHNSHGKWNAIERWQAFFLLYEMLEEYGTHLVEAAWTHQVDLLFQSESSIVSSNFDMKGIFDAQMETSEGIFRWLAILWERGFSHENPQVRCLIMKHFLNIQWEKYRNYVGLVPEPFILGPFVRGLNDIVHHGDFGIKGVYTSSTIQGARTFLSQYCSSLSRSSQARFLCRLASVVRHESFGRAGLMSLAFCLSASCETKTHVQNIADYGGKKLSDFERTHFPDDDLSISDCSNLLDALGVVIERSKQHFNPNYRRQVCEHVLIAACSVMKTSDVPFDVLLHFVSTIPHEFTDINGHLRSKLQKWFLQNEENFIEIEVLNNLYAFPSNFVKRHLSPDASILFDDEDLRVWGSEAERWARVFFLLIYKEQQLDPIFMFLEKTGNNIGKADAHMEWIPVKFFLITLNLIEQLMGGRAKAFSRDADKTKAAVLGCLDQLPYEIHSSIFQRFQRIFFSFLDVLFEFTNSSCNVFWSDAVAQSAILPNSIMGKLGGPVQRRLSSCKRTAVLEAILSIKMVAAIFSWGILFRDDIFIKPLFIFMWNFSWKVILSPSYHSEAGAEIQLAAFEAIVPVFEALSTAFSPPFFDFVRDHNNSLLTEDGTPLLDPLLLNFLKSINEQLANGLLTRSRRAVLMNWKWLCLSSVLSVRFDLKEDSIQSSSTCALFSHSSLEITFLDVVER